MPHKLRRTSYGPPEYACDSYCRCQLKISNYKSGAYSALCMLVGTCQERLAAAKELLTAKEKL